MTRSGNGDDQDGMRPPKSEDIPTKTSNSALSPPPANPAKKRTLQELQSGISEEALESYKRNRVANNDPMAALLGKDELVEMS